MRNLLLLLLLLLCAGAGWILFQQADESVQPVASPEVKPARGTAERVRADLAPPSPARSASAQIAEPKLERESIEVDSAAADESTGDQPMVRVRGHVALLLRGETQRDAGSGQLRLSHPGGELWVLVEEGEFEFELARRTFFQVDQVELEDFDCGLASPFEGVHAEDGLELEVLVCERVSATLHVRDRLSGQDLTGIELWSREGWNHVNSMLPEQDPDASRVLENQASPVRLPVRDGKHTWWAKAAGYAFGAVDFDHRFGGEQILVLDPEAVLVVQLQNRPVSKSVQLLLKRGRMVGPSTKFEIGPLEPGEVRLAELAPGALRVTASLSLQQLLPGEFVTADVELKSGETTVLPLRLPDAAPELPQTELVSVSGTLLVPEGEDGSSAYLEWTWTGGAPEPARKVAVAGVEEESGGLAWHVGNLAPGLWRVAVRPYGYFEELWVGPKGLTGVKLLVPPLAELAIHVRDADSKRPLEDATISMFRAAAGTSPYLGQPERLEEVGEFRAAMAPGELRLDVTCPGFQDLQHKVTVRAGEQNLYLELARSVSVTFVLVDGATLVRREVGWWLADFRSERLDGEGLLVSSRFDNSEAMQIELSAPGSYRFAFGTVDGYLPIEPIELQLDREERRVEVRLIRE